VVRTLHGGSTGLCLLVLPLLAACGGSGGGDDATVRVLATDGAERFAVDVEIADDEAERLAGLRGRDGLDAGEGLLIVLPAQGEVCITNRGVAFAIDAVFASEDGTVTALAAGIAADDDSLHCADGVRYVLEVAAGVAEGVRPGNRVIIP